MSVLCTSFWIHVNDCYTLCFVHETASVYKTKKQTRERKEKKTFTMHALFLSFFLKELQLIASKNGG